MPFTLFRYMYLYTVVQLMCHSSYTLLGYVGHAVTNDRHQQTRAQKNILDSVILLYALAKMMNTCAVVH